MLFFLDNEYNNLYIDVKKVMEKENTVYLIQELPGTRIGQPKFNIMGALKYGKLKVLLKENTQIVLSPTHCVRIKTFVKRLHV